MIKGQIAVTWSEADYKNLTWVTNKVHEEKFNATVDTQNYNVGVYMCFENLPTKFYDAVKDLEFNKVVVAVNKLTPGQILPYHTDKYKTYKERNGITEQDEIITASLSKPILEFINLRNDAIPAPTDGPDSVRDNTSMEFSDINAISCRKS